MTKAKFNNKGELIVDAIGRKEFDYVDRYDGWIISNNILKRSFGILAHYMLAFLLLYLGFFILSFIYGFILGVFFYYT